MAKFQHSYEPVTAWNSTNIPCRHCFKLELGHMQNIAGTWIDTEEIEEWLATIE